MKYKINRKLDTITCSFCKAQFEKPLSEIKRNSEKNRSNYCSRSCVGKATGSLKGKNVKDRYDISLHSSCRRDKFTLFRYTYRCIKRRFKEVTVTLEDLEKQWIKQNGTCPYSKVKLELPTDNKIIPITKRASLDRIDSSKGYIIENIQFVSTPINYMKSTMSHIETIDYLNQISKNISCHQED